MTTASKVDGETFTRASAALLVVHSRRDDGESAVDVRDLAGDAAREVGHEERGHVADLVGGDVAAKRCVLLDKALDLRKAAYARRGEDTRSGLEAHLAQ